MQHAVAAGLVPLLHCFPVVGSKNGTRDPASPAPIGGKGDHPAGIEMEPAGTKEPDPTVVADSSGQQRLEEIFCQVVAGGIYTNWYG